MGVHVAVAVHLQRAHEADVQTAVVVQVELVGHVVDGGRANHRAEHLAGGGEAADAAGFHRQRDVVEHAVLLGVLGDHLRNADADVDDVLLAQLARGAPADDVAGNAALAAGGGDGLELFGPAVPLLKRDFKAAGERGEGFVAGLRLLHDDRVDETARDDGVARTGGHVHDAVHLDDDDAVVGLGGLADGERVAGHVHVVKGDVALAVGGGALDHRDGDFGELVIEEFLAVHRHHLDERGVGGNLVDARALAARVHEDVQADLGERAGDAARLRADGVGDAAQRQVVRLEAVFQNDLLGAGHRAEMAADQAVHGAGADVALRGAVFVPHAEARAGNDRQVLGGMGLFISAAERLVQLHRVFNADKGIDADAVSVADQADGLIRRHDSIHGDSAFGW